MQKMIITTIWQVMQMKKATHIIEEKDIMKLQVGSKATVVGIIMTCILRSTTTTPH
jgi:hypothetical protein